MDLISVIAGMVIGIITGWGISYLFEKQKNTLAIGISEQVALLTMQNEKAAEMMLLETEKHQVECHKADLDRQSAHTEMKIKSTREELARLSALKNDTSAIQSDQQIYLHMQVAGIQKKIGKAENILANLNVHGADYESRRETLDKELLTLREKLSAHQEELKNVPELDLPVQTELHQRRSKEVAKMREQLTKELCRTEEFLKQLEMERAHIEIRREELACKIHCMEERYTGMAVGLKAGGRTAI